MNRLTSIVTLTLLTVSPLSWGSTTTASSGLAPAPVIPAQTVLAPSDFTAGVTTQSQTVQTSIATQLNSLFPGGAGPTTNAPPPTTSTATTPVATSPATVDTEGQS